MDPETKPRYFALKKWTLVSVLAFNVLVMVICIFYADKLIDIALKKSKDVKPEDEENVKKASKAVLIVFFLIVIGFEFLFIYGVLKKNICISTTYAVFAVIGTVGIIGHALTRETANLLAVSLVSQPILWINAFFAIVITVVAILYVRDLRAMRRNEMNEHKRFQLA